MRTYRLLIATLALVLVPWMPDDTRAAAPSWLDAAQPAGWNLPGRPVPAAPRGADTNTDPRCEVQYREPSRSRADRAVAKAGWRLVGPLQVFGPTELVTAATAADGMCRPLGYQAFVFVDGRFAGTLSPRPMDSRADGTAVAVHLVAPDRLTVEYARYADQDPLCCPSAMTAVTFAVRRVRAGVVVEPVALYTSPTSTPAPTASASPPDRPLVNTYWKLTRLEGQDVTAVSGRAEPHLVLRTDGRTVDGSGGCNRLGGAYQLDGARLEFGSLATTKMMCADTIDLERRLVQSLATVRRWRIHGDDLELLDAGGATVAAFVAVDLQ